MNINNLLITESHIFCGLYINSTIRMNMETMEIISAKFEVNTHPTKRAFEGKVMKKGSYKECFEFIGKYRRTHPTFIPLSN